MKKVRREDPVVKLLNSGVREGVFPGGVLCASRKGRIYYDISVGFATLSPFSLPLVATALFDVASLTKAVATTSAAMYLINSGDLELETRVGSVFKSFQRGRLGDITVRDLLNHASGLPAHWELFKELDALRKKGEGPSLGEESLDWAIERIAEIGLAAPPRTKAIYSDLGFIVLGRMIEKIAQQDLDSFCREKIFSPLGMCDTFFLPLFDEPLRNERIKGRQIAATEDCSRRGKLLRGEVHDDNCYSLGGVAGHAGLFSTAQDLHRFALTMMRCARGEASFFPPSLVREFWTKQQIVSNSSWALGWDTPSPRGSQAGQFFSRSFSVGHLGFTGCSLWIDWEKEIIAIFLTNRVHPSRANDKIKKFRPLLHDLLYTILFPQINLPNLPQRSFASNLSGQKVVLPPSSKRGIPSNLPVLKAPEEGLSQRTSLSRFSADSCLPPYLRDPFVKSEISQNLFEPLTADPEVEEYLRGCLEEILFTKE